MAVKKPAAKLDSLLKVKEPPVVRIIHKPALSDFTISKKHHLHAKADVLAQAFPQPPEKVKCPLPVNYVMAFELK
jgi:hypothetical protein